MNSQHYHTSVGIDVAKHSFDLATSRSKQVRHFTYDDHGLRELVKHLRTITSWKPPADWNVAFTVLSPRSASTSPSSTLVRFATTPVPSTSSPRPIRLMHASSRRSRKRCSRAPVNCLPNTRTRCDHWSRADARSSPIAFGKPIDSIERMTATFAA